MCEDFLFSNAKIKKICPYCNACKVEIIKKGLYTDPFTVLFLINNEDIWGALKRSFVILKCLNCSRIFKFYESYTFTAFSEDDVKDEKDLLIDTMNNMSLEDLIKALNKALLLLNNQPFNKVLLERLEMLFFKLKKDKIKIVAENQKNFFKKNTEISFFSYYSVLSEIRKEKRKLILKAQYENAAKLRDIEKLYESWKQSEKLWIFLYQKHFFIKSKHLVVYKEPLNPYLKKEIDSLSKLEL